MGFLREPQIQIRKEKPLSTNVDALAKINSNNKNYVSMYNHFDDYVTLNRRSPIQIEEDADIKFGYWHESGEDEENY